MRRLISTLLLLLTFMMPAAVKADTKSYDIDKLTEKVSIAENGDVQVEEELTYSFSGDFNGVYRNLSKNGAQGIAIADISVRDKNNNITPMKESNSSDNNTYTIANTGTECNIKLFSKSSNENKTFIFHYTIHGAVVKTDDYGELNWSFYTVKNNITVKNVELNLSLKSADFNPDKFKHWAYVDGKDLKDSYDARAIHITGKELTGVFGAKVQFQPDYLQIPAGSKDDSVNRNIIYDSKNYDNYGNTVSETKNNGIMGAVLFLIIAATSIGTAVYMIKANKRYNEAVEAYRSVCIHFNGDIITAPPSDLPPALVNLLIMGKYVSTSAISATLFYLSSRGFYTLEKRPFTKKGSFSEKQEEDLAFIHNYDKGMPDSPHLQFFINWMSRYEDRGVFTLSSIQETVERRGGAIAFKDSFSCWEDTIRHEAYDLGFYVTIEKKEILSNKYYDEENKWLAYKRYLLKYIGDNENLTPIANSDEALVYASALEIGNGEIEELFARINNESNGSSADFYYSGYNYYPFFITNYYMWNGIYHNMYEDSSSNIDNSSSNNFFGGDGGGFGGFSDGGGFSGGGGGDSGAF